jgi:hypothetical protein
MGAVEHNAVQVAFVTMSALAPKLGLASARAVRDWCRKRGVPYRRDGKLNWVRVADFEAAIARIPVSNDTDRAAAATDAVLSLTRVGAKHPSASNSDPLLSFSKLGSKRR